MHKYLYFLFAIVLIVGIIMIGCSKINKQEMPIYMAQINEMIDSVLLSDEYQEADYLQRKENIEKLLRNMEDKGYIRHYSFDDNGGLFSFIYPDGTLGGIYINEFSNNKNPFPMN